MKVVCPYCGNNAQLSSAEIIYKRKGFGQVWYCHPCFAYVGTHRGTSRPLGTLANAELREWRRKAHAAFDPLWNKRVPQIHTKRWNRNRCYMWLAEKLKISELACHIGMFNIDLCKKTIEHCDKLLKPKDNLIDLDLPEVVE